MNTLGLVAGWRLMKQYPEDFEVLISFSADEISELQAVARRCLLNAAGRQDDDRSHPATDSTAPGQGRAPTFHSRSPRRVSSAIRTSHQRSERRAAASSFSVGACMALSFQPASLATPHNEFAGQA